MLAVVQDDAVFTPPQQPATITVGTLSGQERVSATTERGVVAVFTPGSRTVAISGLPMRTFTEQKRVGPATTDTFSRTRTSRWGLSPYYGTWSSPVGGLDTDWTVDGTSAKVLVNSASVSRYCSLLDKDVIDYDIRVPVSLSTVPTDATNSLSLTGNYASTDSHYRFRWSVTVAGTVQLGIDRVVGGLSTLVASSVDVGTGYTPGQVWVIRASQEGGQVRCMAWPEGATPPADWQRSYTDPSPLGPGRVGIRAFLSAGATNTQTFTLSEFEITSARWASPPVVTHDTRVRLLPQPFSAWNDDVEAWLRRAVVDSTPDLLACAMSYVTGAAPVLDPQYGAGRQVLGQASYGPNETNGARVEGADWNDYIRTTGHYPHLTVPVDDINELDQQFCLDCSGFVRMIFGYWGGTPMSLTDPADLNGINLPRRSVQIGPSGPGVLIAVGTTEPPPLTSIQIGDVLSFNADAADDVAGEEGGDVEQADDHVGIYLGRDAAGNHVYVSSRKTANGPTFAALGGPSYLDGTGMWAYSLRHIRRI